MRLAEGEVTQGGVWTDKEFDPTQIIAYFKEPPDFSIKPRYVAMDERTYDAVARWLEEDKER